DPSLPTAVSIPPTLAIALVWPGRQYLSQFRLGQFQYHLPNSSSQRFAQPIRSKKTFHLAETLYTFPHRRIPPRSDSPHDPDSFLGYRENTPSLFSTTSGPPPELILPADLKAYILPAALPFILSHLGGGPITAPLDRPILELKASVRPR